MVESVRAALVRAAAMLDFSQSARLDAELLMAHALGIERDAMLLGRLDGETPPGFAALLDRRCAQEPVAYILGHRDFWTIRLDVGPGVLIPRADSETLIEAAVDHFGKAGPARVIDLGTGSGALLLAALAEWPEAHGIGIDRSDVALEIARANAASLGLADRATFRAGDWAAGIDARFDLVLCNPPYVESGDMLAPEVADHEPVTALYAGADGLDDYRRLAPQIARLIAPGGIAAIEIGWRQTEAVGALLTAEGLSVVVRKDLGGRDRCIVATP